MRCFLGVRNHGAAKVAQNLKNRCPEGRRARFLMVFWHNSGAHVDEKPGCAENVYFATSIRRELRFHHGEPGILTPLLHQISLHSRLASQNGRGRPRVEQFYGPGAPFERSSNPLPPQRPPAPLQGSIFNDFRWILTCLWASL